jgi:hypothetical protein
MRLGAGLIVILSVLCISPMAGAVTDVTPGVFSEVSTGVAYITTFKCDGHPLGQGTGFLVGTSVVMTARHVVKGACRVHIRVDGDTFEVTHYAYWFGGRASLDAVDIATLKLDHAAEGAHVFRIRSTLPPFGTNVGMVGYPLGNRLSLNQGKIIRRWTLDGAPVMVVKMLGAEGASGAPYIDDSGRVVGILQVGLGSKDIVGQRTAGVLYGLDLVRWWGPQARLDLCRAYPHGGIAGCPSPKPPPGPKPPPPPPPPPPKSTTFSDSVGEDPSAPDITSIVVQSDSARSITFQINIPNRPALTGDMFLLVFIDSDNNSTTGDQGADYVIDLEPGQIGLFQWNGAQYVAAASQTSLTYSYASGATIHISANDLGNTRAFAFAALAFSGFAVTNGQPDNTNLKRDSAPDPGHGMYQYSL